MKIAIVSTPFVAVPPPAYGGTELVVHELVRGLSRAGHDVTLFATGDSEAADVRALFRRPVWPPSPDVAQAHAEFAARLIAGASFDVVHAHLAELLPYARHLGAPVVYTLHHERDEALLALYAAHPEVRCVAISRRQAELTPELETTVVHHGLDPEAYPMGRGDGGYALFIGRLSWCKGPDLAVEACQRAGVELAVAGEFHDEPSNPPGWQPRLTALLARPGVRRAGPVGGVRKLRLLGSASAVVMPIRWEEPFGLVLVESMLCGTPVVAFRRGAAAEIVEDGVTGFLVDDIPGMVAALREVGRIDRDACRRRARERFAAARMLRDYLRVYHAAIAHDRRRRLGAAEEGGAYASA